MGVSKVTLNGVTLMDVTDKTVDTDNLLAGNSALRNDGESITGAVVTASPSDASPAMDGTASAGVATAYSRGDHVHPSDTSRQATITASGILKGNGSGAITAATAGTDYQAPLPSQSGNSGKYLTTNGSVLSWGDVDALPSQTGNSGKFLTTNGTDASWTAITQDDHKWGTVEFGRSGSNLNAASYIPQLESTSATSSTLATATHTPTNYAIAKYDGSAILYSTTPTSGDSSTKVATTAFVGSAISALGSVLNFKGTKTTESALPSTGNTTGDVWVVTTDNSEYVWTGSAWEKLGTTVDLSGYVPTSRTINGKALSTDISLSASDVGALPSSTTIPTATSDLTNDSGFITGSDIPVTSVNTKTGAVTLTASDVGALPDDTTIPQGTVTSVRVQATSPVQSSTSTEQTTSLNTTISLADGYGDTKNPYAAKSKNKVLAGPTTGSDAAPSFRALDASDIPSLTVSKISDFPNTMTPSSHTHGNITNAGDITTTATIANGDRLVINDESASKITNSSITFGTSETTYLTNKGTWKTPDYPVTSVNTKTGAVSLSASDVGALPDSTDVTKWNGVSLTKRILSQAGGYKIPALTSLTGTDANLAFAHYNPASYTIALWDDDSYLYSTTPSSGDNSTKVATTAYVDSAVGAITVPVTSVNSKTGVVVLTAADVGALPTTTSIPSATSDLTNDSGFITSSDVPSASSTTPVVDGTATTGVETSWARGDHVHPTDTSRQAKITASGILKGDGQGGVTAAIAGTDYSVGDEVFLVETTTDTQQQVITANKTFAEITAAYTAQKVIVDIHDTAVMYYLQYINSTAAIFVNPTYTNGHPFMQMLQVTSENVWSWFSAEATAANIGALPISGGTMNGQIKTSFGEAVAMGTRGSAQQTIPNLVNELRYSSGVAGSFSLGTAYELNASSPIIPVGWYNYFWVPHRSGGINGQADQDNCDYGTLYLSEMTGDCGVYAIRYTSQTISAVHRLDNPQNAGGWNQPIYFYRGQAYPIDWYISNAGAPADCNTVGNNFCGYYTANGPSTAIGATTGDGALWNQAYNTAWMGQIAQDYRNGNLFVRSKNNGTFTTWRKVGINTTITVSLPVASWNTSTKQISVSASGVTASNLVEVSPAPASWSVASAAGVYCSAQAANSLTFKCSSIPTAAITVNVVIWG